MEPTLRSAQVLKQEAENLGYEGKEIMEYVKEQQKFDSDFILLQGKYPQVQH